MRWDLIPESKGGLRSLKEGEQVQGRALLAAQKMSFLGPFPAQKCHFWVFLQPRNSWEEQFPLQLDWECCRSSQEGEKQNSLSNSEQLQQQENCQGRSRAGPGPVTCWDLLEFSSWLAQAGGKSQDLGSSSSLSPSPSLPAAPFSTRIFPLLPRLNNPLISK